MTRLGLLLALALTAACANDGQTPGGGDPDCYDTTVPEALWPRDKTGLPPCP